MESGVYNEKEIASYGGVYKENIIAKPQEIKLTVTARHVYGIAYACEQIGVSENDPVYTRFSCGLEEITKIYVNNANAKISPIYIQCDSDVKGSVIRRRVILPCLPNPEEIVESVIKLKEEFDQKLEKRREVEKRQRIGGIDKSAVVKNDAEIPLKYSENLTGAALRDEKSRRAEAAEDESEAQAFEALVTEEIIKPAVKEGKKQSGTVMERVMGRVRSAVAPHKTAGIPSKAKETSPKGVDAGDKLMTSLEDELSLSEKNVYPAEERTASFAAGAKPDADEAAQLEEQLPTEESVTVSDFSVRKNFRKKEFSFKTDTPIKMPPPETDKKPDVDLEANRFLVEDMLGIYDLVGGVSADKKETLAGRTNVSDNIEAAPETSAAPEEIIFQKEPADIEELVPPELSEDDFIGAATKGQESYSDEIETINTEEYLKKAARARSAPAKPVAAESEPEEPKRNPAINIEIKESMTLAEFEEAVKKLKTLLDSGKISQSEFVTEKDRLISVLN